MAVEEGQDWVTLEGTCWIFYARWSWLVGGGACSCTVVSVTLALIPEIIESLGGRGSC